MEDQRGLKINPMLEIKKVATEIDKAIHDLRTQANEIKEKYPDTHDKRRDQILANILEEQQRLRETMKEAMQAFEEEIPQEGE